MYAAIRQVKAKAGTADQLASRIKDAIPIISSVQGFMGYYVIYGTGRHGDGDPHLQQRRQR